MRQISFLNLAKAFGLQNLRVARITFLYKNFEYKICLTFNTGGILAFNKLRTDP